MVKYIESPSYDVNESGLESMQQRIDSLAETVSELLNSIAVNLDDQEFSDLIIFAKARAVLETCKSQ